MRTCLARSWPPLLALLAACGEGRSSAPDVRFGPRFGGPLAARVDVLTPPRAVVLIVIDTLRADHVGALGSTLGLTPALDALALDSVVFANALAASSWTRASVGSLFTSRYPTSAGCRDRDDALPDGCETLAEALGAAGFHCVGVHSNGNVGREFGFAQGFDVYCMPPRSGYVGYPDGYGMYAAEGVTTTALHEVDRWRSGENAGDPLLLYVHYIDPHDPYMPHPELGLEAPPEGRFSGSREDLRRLRYPGFEVLESDREWVRHLYRGEVRYCDLWVGRLLEGLEERFGSLDDVLIVVTADHGEGLWDHGQRRHGCDLFEEQIHVPLIVKPTRAVLAQGTLVRTPVSLVDVASTILAQCGVAALAGTQGSDLSEVWRGGARATGPAVYSEIDLDGVDLDMLRVGASKLIHKRDALPQARRYLRFDLAGDPNETVDLHQTAAEEPLDAELRAALEAWSAALERAQEASRQVDESSLDPDTLENLRALGYLDDE